MAREERCFHCGRAQVTGCFAQVRTGSGAGEVTGCGGGQGAPGVEGRRDARTSPAGARWACIGGRIGALESDAPVDKNVRVSLKAFRHGNE
jgi:hypothetical protein